MVTASARRQLRRGRAAEPPASLPSVRAFALLDVILGTILMGISLAAVVGLTGRALSSQQRGEELQTAALLADEQLALVLARGPDNYERRFNVSGACEAPFQNYRYALDLSGGSGNQPYTVTATITWAGGSLLSREQSLSIQTFIAPREGDDPDPDRKPSESTTRTP